MFVLIALGPKWGARRFCLVIHVVSLYCVCGFWVDEVVSSALKRSIWVPDLDAPLYTWCDKGALGLVGDELARWDRAPLPRPFDAAVSKSGSYSDLLDKFTVTVATPGGGTSTVSGPVAVQHLGQLCGRAFSWWSSGVTSAAAPEGGVVAFLIIAVCEAMRQDCVAYRVHRAMRGFGMWVGDLWQAPSQSDMPPPVAWNLSIQALQAGNDQSKFGELVIAVRTALQAEPWDALMTGRGVFAGSIVSVCNPNWDHGFGCPGNCGVLTRRPRGG